MKDNGLTIKILNNTLFSDAYEDFLLDRNMTSDRYRIMLELATLLINSSNESVQQLGYRIIVIYSNRTKDYKPLYDVSQHQGLVPVSQFIDDKLIQADEKNVFTELNSANNYEYFNGGVFHTKQQKELYEFYQ